MPKALARHNSIVRAACAGNNVYVCKTLGDASCVAFGAANDVLAATIDLQLGLLAEDSQAMGMTTPLSLRLALHTGPVETRGLLRADPEPHFKAACGRTRRTVPALGGNREDSSQAPARQHDAQVTRRTLLQGPAATGERLPTGVPAAAGGLPAAQVTRGETPQPAAPTDAVRGTGDCARGCSHAPSRPGHPALDTPWSGWDWDDPDRPQEQESRPEIITGLEVMGIAIQ